MSKFENFGATSDVAITVLVDNHSDLMEESTDTVKRFNEQPLLAEHGFAALIELKSAGIQILWDAGITEISLLENMQRMKIDPSSINIIALSHGHGDHTAGLTEVLKAMDIEPEAREWSADTTMEEILLWMAGRQVPIVAHPAALRERWGVDENGKKFGPVQPPPRAAWEAYGGQVILSEKPYQLGPGCWTTGAIPRTSFEKSGIPDRMIFREGDNFHKDIIEDDQAIVININAKGLVILSGCAHSGIVNTISYAQQISGVDKVTAVLGGFHLVRANEEEIRRTVKAIQAIGPEMIVPSHCTGFKASAQFCHMMPEQFVVGLVGTRYEF
jgi:7,8-dihydropterin-6-yl-methyl-4-(beta-D-ribofuranosyl)aminobenzene 5'-phosphate synthase